MVPLQNEIYSLVFRSCYFQIDSIITLHNRSFTTYWHFTIHSNQLSCTPFVSSRVPLIVLLLRLPQERFTLVLVLFTTGLIWHHSELKKESPLYCGQLTLSLTISTPKYNVIYTVSHAIYHWFFLTLPLIKDVQRLFVLHSTLAQQQVTSCSVDHYATSEFSYVFVSLDLPFFGIIVQPFSIQMLHLNELQSTLNAKTATPQSNMSYTLLNNCCFFSGPRLTLIGSKQTSEQRMSFAAFRIQYASIIQMVHLIDEPLLLVYECNHA